MKRRPASKSGRKNMVTTIISIVLICAAAFVLLNAKFKWVDLKAWGGKANPGEPRDIQVVAIDEIDLSKHYVWKGKDEDYPLKNPDTGARTLYPAYVCRKEKVLFMSKPPEVIMRCPFCKNIECGGASKEDMELDVRPRDYQE